MLITPDMLTPAMRSVRSYSLINLASWVALTDVWLERKAVTAASRSLALEFPSRTGWFSRALTSIILSKRGYKSGIAESRNAE